MPQVRRVPMRKQGLRYERRSDDFDRTGGAFGRAAAGNGVVRGHGRLHSDFERLGEEGTFALIQPIYELMAGAVKEQGGSVKDFTGDGIMALFGVPEALEDAPLRACRAGCSFMNVSLRPRPRSRPSTACCPRCASGLIRASRWSRNSRESAAMTALGDTVNVASRLQTLAEPGTVFLSEATQRLVQGLVETTFAGAHAIKGKAESQKVYRLDSSVRAQRGSRRP